MAVRAAGHGDRRRQRKRRRQNRARAARRTARPGARFSGRADARYARLSGGVRRVLARFSLGAYQRSRLWIEYLGGGRGSATERAVDVYGLVYRTGFWYAVAYCHLREDLRVFRLDRVRRFACWTRLSPRRRSSTRSITCSTRLRPFPAYWAGRSAVQGDAGTGRAARHARSVGMLEAAPGGVLLHCYADGLEWMARFLIGTGLKFTVHRPARTARQAARDRPLNFAHGEEGPDVCKLLNWN